MPELTYIVPCYNMAPWIPVALESCLEQTESDIEILIVNDGSTDNSDAICECYARRDKRIRVIHQENQGSAVARLTGQNHASGTYVTWLDADDFVDRVHAEAMVGLAKRDNVDMVCGNAIVFSEKTLNTRKYFYKSEISRTSFDNSDYWKSKVLWRWIFNLDFLQRIDFPHPDFKFGHDVCSMFKALCEVDTFSQTQEFVYYFRQEHKRMTQTMALLVDDQLKHFQFCKDVLVQYDRLHPLAKYLQENYFRDTREIARRMRTEDPVWKDKWLSTSLQLFSGLKEDMFTEEFFKPELKLNSTFAELARALSREDEQKAMSVFDSLIPSAQPAEGFGGDKSNAFHTARRRMKALFSPLSRRTRKNLRLYEKRSRDFLRECGI